MNKPRRHSQSGAALMTVLWLSLFLSMIMAIAFSTVRIEARITRAEMKLFQATQMAKGELNVTMARLLESASERQSVEFPLVTTVDDWTIEVSLSEEMRKADLNHADETAMSAALIQAGMEPEPASHFAARIADWRDADSLARPNGAESGDYFGADLPQQIGDRPFLSVKELSYVLNADETILECANDHFTVFGRKTPLASRTGNLTAATLTTPGSRLVLSASVRDENDQVVLQDYSTAYLVTGRPESPFSIVIERISPSMSRICSG